MTYQGIDTVHRFTAADAKKAAESGVSFVGRYRRIKSNTRATIVTALIFLGI